MNDMNIDVLKSQIDQQAVTLSDHQDKCISTFPTSQFLQSYILSSNQQVDVLLQLNHNNQEAKAFVKISPENNLLEEVIRSIFPEKFKVNFVQDIDSNRKWWHCKLDLENGCRN